MLSGLPDHVDPFRLCDQARSFEGRLNLADLPRLAEAVVSTEGQASYRIACDRDEHRRARIRGSVEAELVVVCQRCMGPMNWPVHAEFQLGVVTSEAQAEQLPDDYDVLLLEGETIQLASLIEDELLLAVPVAPLHPADECSVNPADWSPPEIEPETDSKRENPFAVLAGLKRPEKDN
jgi:uncharacterized protein